MVFVFGVDIPLVEMIFVLTIILVILLGLLIYLVIGQVKLKRELKIVISKENVELGDLKEIQEEEKGNIGLLRAIKSELDKLLYSRLQRAPKEVKVVKKKKKTTRKKRAKEAVKVRTIIQRILKRPKEIYVAAKDGKILHIKECPFAKKIREESRIIFKSKTKAFNEGYKACSCIKNVKIKKKKISKRKAAKKTLEFRTVVKTVVQKQKKRYVASVDGDTVHQENCPFAKKIGEKNRVYFKSKTKAFDKGYKACYCI